jgi:hypothetical protein
MMQILSDQFLLNEGMYTAEGRRLSMISAQANLPRMPGLTGIHADRAQQAE